MRMLIRLVSGHDANVATGSPSSQYKELYCLFVFFHFYANVQRNVT